MVKCKICSYNIKNKSLFRCPKCNSSLWKIGRNVPCDICFKTFLNPIIHHIDGNRRNNKPNNLITLCKKCHVLIHKGYSKKDYIEYKEAKKVAQLESKLNKFINKYLSDINNIKKDIKSKSRIKERILYFREIWLNNKYKK